MQVRAAIVRTESERAGTSGTKLAHDVLEMFMEIDDERYDRNPMD